MFRIEILSFAHIFALEGESPVGILEPAGPGKPRGRDGKAAGGSQEGDVVLHAGGELVHDAPLHHDRMLRLAAEEGQQVQRQVAAHEGRPPRRPEAVLGQAAEELHRQPAVRGMEGEAAAGEGVVQAQFPVLPGAEEQSAPQLVEEGAGRCFDEAAVPGQIQAREACALQLGGVASQGLRIPLRLQSGPEAAGRIVQLEIIVGAPGMLGRADDSVLQVVDGVRFQAPGHAAALLRAQSGRKEGRQEQDKKPAVYFP